LYYQDVEEVVSIDEIGFLSEQKMEVQSLPQQFLSPFINKV